MENQSSQTFDPHEEFSIEPWAGHGQKTYNDANSALLNNLVRESEHENNVENGTIYKWEA